MGFLVRIEGKPSSYFFRNIYGYAKKAYFKNWDASEETKAHFIAQGEALRELGSAAALPSDVLRTRLGFVGDLVWVQNVTPELPAPELLAHLNSHDLLLGNLETSVSPRHPVPEFFPLRTRFNSPRGILAAFRRPDGGNSFSALSLANNHALDFGDAGLCGTMDSLTALKIPWTGAGATRSESPGYVTLVSHGIRVGFYAATYGVNRDAQLRSQCGLNVVPQLVGEGDVGDLGEIERALATMARDGVDFKVVSLHWGHEYELYPDPRQRQIARRLAAAGADVIMGHHPHVVQPSEVIWGEGPAGPRKTLVLYSLGNFLSNMFSFYLGAGLVSSVTLTKDERTGRVDWHLPSFRFTYSRRRNQAVAGHRLLLMEQHLADARGARDGVDFARLRRHVGGVAL